MCMKTSWILAGTAILAGWLTLSAMAEEGAPPAGPDSASSARPPRADQERPGAGAGQRPGAASELSDDQIDRLFKAFDADGDGQIDRKELARRAPTLLERMRRNNQAGAPGRPGRSEQSDAAPGVRRPRRADGAQKPSAGPDGVDKRPDGPKKSHDDGDAGKPGFKHPGKPDMDKQDKAKKDKDRGSAKDETCPRCGCACAMGRAADGKAPFARGGGRGAGFGFSENRSMRSFGEVRGRGMGRGGWGDRQRGPRDDAWGGRDRARNNDRWAGRQRDKSGDAPAFRPPGMQRGWGRGMEKNAGDTRRDFGPPRGLDRRDDGPPFGVRDGRGGPRGDGDRFPPGREMSRPRLDGQGPQGRWDRDRDDDDDMPTRLGPPRFGRD